jgi:Tfp pilus assembly protein PilV
MLHILYDKHGMSMVEVIVAIFLTAVAVIGVLSLQSSAWRTAGLSDYLGRAAGILYGELETREAFILNPVNVVTAGTTTNTVFASGQTTALEGDASYTVTTTITSLGAGTNAWRVTVTVTWPPRNLTGITENIVVTRQDRYRF